MMAENVEPGVKAGTWRQMGLTDAEYERIVATLGREPNYTELGMYAVLWSEHCAYKHTRPLFHLFPTSGERILQGPGENAGAVNIGHGLACVFKVESHNHPSAVEPYQGAATGVGGILRDIFTMGARPVAVLDSLRFGPLTSERVRYLLGGVVGGIAGYGNAIGVPTVGGELSFDPSYEGNPLVNVMCVGVAPADRLARGVASGVGNPVMVVGATTGRDGIHGATFASVQLDADSESKRPSVQVGDPFMEKLLLEACLELLAEDVVIGIQDMGAAGLTSSAAEMAARAGTGIELDIALVPRREEGMTPYEVMLSESQERMLVVPKAGAEERVREIFARWGLVASVIGRVTDDGYLRVLDGGKVAAEVPARSLSTDGAPSYTPPRREPKWRRELISFDVEKELPQPKSRAEYEALLLTLLASPNLASKAWVFEQYDYMVQTNTVIGPGGDAAVIRIKETEAGLAVTIDGNGRYCLLDPFVGAQIAVAEAARNIAVTGALPLAVTDGLNFGNPEKPEVYWQIVEAVKGIAAACRALGTPVTGGNASLYNETEGRAIMPTPIIGMVGLLDDAKKAVRAGFSSTAVGAKLVLLGESGNDLGGTEYLWVRKGVVAGRPPKVDLDAEKALIRALRRAAEDGMLAAAHDCAEGGLLVTVAESCLLGGRAHSGRAEQGKEGVGATVTFNRADFPVGLRLDALLFGESQGRAVVAVFPERLEDLRTVCREEGVPFRVLGDVGGERLVVKVAGEAEDWLTGEGNGLGLSDAEVAASGDDSRVIVDLYLAHLRERWQNGLEEALGVHAE